LPTVWRTITSPATDDPGDLERVVLSDPDGPEHQQERLERRRRHGDVLVAGPI
jgi:hypothetical protein